MAPRIIQILEAYTQLYAETGKDQPLIVMARLVVILSLCQQKPGGYPVRA